MARPRTKCPKFHKSSHFKTAELRRIRRGVNRIRYGAEVRLVYHLGGLCPACWSALRELPPPESELKATDVPLVLALRRLAITPEAVLALDANHRTCVLDAGERPLGFCFLLLEEIRKIAPSTPRDAAKYLRLRAGAVAGSGVLLLYAREAHDYHGLYLSSLATALCGANELRQAGEAIELARFHLDHGSGRADRWAGYLEARAALARAANRRDWAWGFLEDAAALLSDHDPADRRAEILLCQANAMLADDSKKRDQAVRINREALAILDSLAPGTNPLLRVKLIHQLASIHMAVYLENRLRGTPARRSAGRKPAEKELLRSAALYRRHGTPGLRGERAGFLGLIYLDNNHSAAMDMLREATAAFAESGDVDSAVNFVLRLVYLKMADEPTGNPDKVDWSIFHEIWQLPEQGEFFHKVYKGFNEAMVEDWKIGWRLKTLKPFVRQLKYNILESKDPFMTRPREGPAQKVRTMVRRTEEDASPNGANPALPVKTGRRKK